MALFSEKISIKEFVISIYTVLVFKKVCRAVCNWFDDWIRIQRLEILKKYFCH